MEEKTYLKRRCGIEAEGDNLAASFGSSVGILYYVRIFGSLK